MRFASQQSAFRRFMFFTLKLGRDGEHAARHLKGMRESKRLW
jgi:hypothetical protein